MNFENFIGIDVSKNELDFSVVKSGVELFHLETPNSILGIKLFLKKLKVECAWEFETTLFCMEHTGIYNNHLLDYLYKQKANVCVESAIHIKQSSGLQRGKNDKVDSLRIAIYAYKNRDELKLWQPKREIIQKLKHLSVLRSRLLVSKKQLSTPLKESSGFVDKSIVKLTSSLCNSSLKAVVKDLEKIELAIDLIIKSDNHLDHLFSIITSVGGVGKVTATEIIITTNEFKDINDPAKFACYAGVAPFEHSSGSSIRGRSRVSKMANKKIKTLLHMAAMVAICYNQELKEYYERKVSTGKNKMSVINAVRNKLILRIFSCVNQNRKYEKTYINMLA